MGLEGGELGEVGVYAGLEDGGGGVDELEMGFVALRMLVWDFFLDGIWLVWTYARRLTRSRSSIRLCARILLRFGRPLMHLLRSACR